MKKISVVITDLDNTLYDWVGMWHGAFRAMVDSLVAQSGIAEEALLREIQSIYQRAGTTEYSFLIAELPSLRSKKHSPREDLTKTYSDAIDAFRVSRRETLKLFSGVAETLRELRKAGCLLVGYTESMAFYSIYRMRKLELDGALDYLYSPADHDVPAGLSIKQIRYYDPDQYRLHKTEHRHTPAGEVKPNPRVLLDILAEVGAKKGEVLYIGDSLSRDIVMANEAGVTSAWAKYGDARNRPEYDLLCKVSHWTEEEIARERERSKHEACPDYSFGKSFAEMMNVVEPMPFTSNPKSPAPIS